MTKITNNTIKTLKEIASALNDEINAEKSKELNPRDSVDLSNFEENIEEKIEDKFGDNLGEYMNGDCNLDVFDALFYGANLNVYVGDSMITVYTRDEDIANPDDEPLDIVEVYNIIRKLSQFSPNKITNLIKRNQNISKKIVHLQNEANTF